MNGPKIKWGQLNQMSLRKSQTNSSNKLKLTHPAGYTKGVLNCLIRPTRWESTNNKHNLNTLTKETNHY